jgi:hypothetical protein
VTQWCFFSPEFSSWSSQHLGIYQICLPSLDWFKGKFTGTPFI